MPTPIELFTGRKKRQNNDHHDMIKATVRSNYLPRLMPDDPYVGYDELVDCYWSEEQRRMIKFTLDECVDVNQIDPQMVGYERMVHIEHPAFPIHFWVPVTLNIQQPSGQPNKVWPKTVHNINFRDRFSGVKRLDEVAERIAICALEKGLLREVTDWLLNNCQNHEQAAYLCPGWVALIRRAGLDEQANAVMDCTRPRNLPMVPPMMRMRLKWIHNFFALHELLETFDRRGPVPEQGDMCKVYLAHNLTVERPIGDDTFSALLIS